MYVIVALGCHTDLVALHVVSRDKCVAPITEPFNLTCVLN
jgi:hypothetical protein